MPYVVSVQQMRESDAWTIAHKVPSRELMFRAGKGIFEAGEWKEPVGIICGKGNNAGDGFVVGMLMKKAGIDCTIVLLSDAFSEDGRYYFEQCQKEQVKITASMDLSGYQSLLDCIFGTGFKGEPREPYAEMIRRINKRREEGTYVVSADINSGLNGDTGMGSLFVLSDLTVSIGDYKYGHFDGMADTAMKDKVNIDIGIEIQGEKDIR